MTRSRGAFTILVIIVELCSTTRDIWGPGADFHTSLDWNRIGITVSTMQATSFKEHIVGTYNLQVYRLILSYQFHAKMCTKAAANAKFIYTCIKSRILPNFAKIKINPNNRKGAFSIYRAQCDYMKSCLSSHRITKCKNYQLRQKFFHTIRNTLTREDTKLVSTLTMNMCNSMWNAIGATHARKLAVLKAKNQYTYNILNKFSPDNEKKGLGEAIKNKIKVYGPHVYNAFNKVNFVNLSSHVLDSKDSAYLSKNAKNVFHYSKQDLLMVAAQMDNIARKIEISNQKHPQSQQSPRKTKTCKRNIIRPTDYVQFPIPSKSLQLPFNNVSSSISSQKLLSFIPPSRIIKPPVYACPSPALRDSIRAGEVILSHADKGGSNVIMNREDYVNAAAQTLQDGNYCKLKSDPTLPLNRALTGVLTKCLKADYISKYEYAYIHNTTPRIPTFKVFPKIHKQPIAYRPLVDAFRSYNYFLSRYLLDKLRPLELSIPHNLPNAVALKNDLLSLPPSSFTKHTMYSLDIVALYPSIPLDLAIKTVLDINETYELVNFPGDVLKQLLECATYTYFAFNDSFYRQTKGLAMGSSLSGFLANLFLFHHIEKNPIFYHPSITYYKRYVDDTFLLINDVDFDIEGHIRNINAIHPNIKFTWERESNQSIQFLDLTITRIPTNYFNFAVAHKSYSTISPIHWLSFHPPNMKIGIYKSYIHRCITYSSSTIDFWREITIIIHAFTLQNYPPHILIQVLVQFILRKWPDLMNTLIRSKNCNLDNRKRAINCANLTVPKAPQNVDDSPMTVGSHVYTNMIYIPCVSPNILKEFTKEFKAKNFKITNAWTPLKPPLKSNLSLTQINAKLSPCVYSAWCPDCDNTLIYIGETGRGLQIRAKEHLNPRNVSAIAKHIQLTSHNSIRFSKTMNVSDPALRKIVEMLLVKHHKPPLNDTIDLRSFIAIKCGDIIDAVPLEASSRAQLMLPSCCSCDNQSSAHVQ